MKIYAIVSGSLGTWGRSGGMRWTLLDNNLDLETAERLATQGGGSVRVILNSEVPAGVGIMDSWETSSSVGGRRK